MITTELMCLWKKSYCHPDMINLVPHDWKPGSVQNPDKTILPIVVTDSNFLCALRRFSAFIGDNTSVKVFFIILLSIRSSTVLSK
jgi:hypothetical protein